MASTRHPESPRRRADAERNIAAILDAGRELFGRGANPSMSEIARAAGVGRVTLYAHFPAREVLLEAVIERAITETEEALDALGLHAEVADEALATIIRTSWPILDRYRKLRTVAHAELGPERLRHHHDRVLQRTEQLIARGQDDGVIRTDLPRGWLVATFYAVLHAAADEVNAGRLAAAKAPDVLTATVLSLLRPGHIRTSTRRVRRGP